MASCQNYKEIFDVMQKKLEAGGMTVINPAVLPDGLEHDKYMPICLQMIESADAILMFNDWENSKGAMLEKAYAEYQGKEVIYG